MTSDSTQNWLRAAAVCAVVVLTLTGSTLAPVATATAPVPTNERITNGIASSTATANTASVTISGTVTYPNGSVAENVTLRWITEDGGETDLQQTVTHLDGSYTATLEENRSYEVKLWQADLSGVNASTPTNVVYPKDGVADFTSLGWLNTSTTDVARNYSFPVGHVLNVTVENESGAPVEDAPVGLRDGTGETAASIYSYLYADGVPTDAQGRMKHPPNPGTGIEVNGTTSVSVRPPENSSYEGNYTRITVASDRDLTRTLTSSTSDSTDTPTVTGTVRNPDGTPASNVTLQWEGLDGTSGFEQAVTDDEGHFTAQVDEPGDYHLSYWQGDVQAGNVTYPRDGVADFGNLGAVSISGDRTANYTLQVGHALNVTVENDSGAPVTGAEVGLSDHHSTTGERTYFHGYRDGGVPTDAQARMKHPENPLPGIEVNGSVGAYVDDPAGTDYDHAYDEYDVNAPRDETLVLYETTTVSGTVRNPDGTPASNVTLDFWTGQEDGHGERIATDADGTYTVQLRADRDYEVQTWQADVTDADSPTEVVYPKDDVADFAALGWHNTTAGNETRNFTLPVGHTLNVTVENTSGAPIENSSVQLVDREEGTWASLYTYLHEDGVPTDAQGRMTHPANPTVGIEVNSSIDVNVHPPEDTEYKRNDTEVSATGDRDVSVTLRRSAEVEGRLVGPEGGAIADATVYVVNWSTGVFESTTTETGGNFSAIVPDGTYGIYVDVGRTGDGIANAWVFKDVTAFGDTDLGNVTLPRGYATTVNVTDNAGRQLDAYTDVRGGNGGWIFQYGHGQQLDRPSNTDTRTVDLTNGTHPATIHDSWTHDVLGTGFVTVRGTDRTTTFGVDRFNGTRVSGAVGTAVARDLQTPTDDQTAQDVLNQGVNVRLFVLNATSETDLHVAELLPEGYELNGTTANVSADGPGHIENVTYGNGVLTFDVKGEVSEVRYRAVPNGTASSEVRFAGEFGGDTPTIGQSSLPAEANVSVFAPADGAVVGSSMPTVQFVTRHPDAANVTDVEYRVDGGSWQDVYGTPAIGGAQLSSLADGQHTVTVRLVNENGTVVTDTTTFTVDTA
ncbi:hypothetical protein [Halorussus lipolyticus]|uniref:hypothetical protein n=1 Tax=Halorussus lipolyticus TaxID=3034024 RepID=UPI0023E8E1F8|nr:hypothetical protein [Halorussus sp. DT80]